MSDPAGTRNIVIFGQTGAGKSSLINMLAGSSVARVSSDASGCTSSNQSYAIGADNDFVFWDTVGLNEAENGTMSSQAAVQNLLNLVKDNGINLIIYCIRGRLVDIVRINYDLFWRIICQGRVPIVLVVTGLEGEADMDDWWRMNQKAIRKMKLSFDGHACITTWRGRKDMYQQEYEESAAKVWKLVRMHSSREPWNIPSDWPAQAQREIKAFEDNYYNSRSENGVRRLFNRIRRIFFL